MSGDLDGLAGLSLIVIFGVFDGDYFDSHGVIAGALFSPKFKLAQTIS
jgi:hypothetical protein